MASLRSVRKAFRRELRQLMASKGGYLLPHEGVALARAMFGREVGVDDLMESYCANQFNAAMAYLRSDRVAESVGREWVAVSQLKPEQVDGVTLRRLKRIVGELRSQVALDHETGRTEEAVKHSLALRDFEALLKPIEQAQKAVTANGE